jgi:hypothetical protein
MQARSSLWLVSLVGVVAVGCSAGSTDTSGSGASGQGGSSSSTASAQGGSTGTFTGTGGSSDGGGGGVVMNVCGTKCGPVELCDGENKGIDDDCDGQVDEECPCMNGQASSCFKGDPSFLDSPGCLPGTMYCTELGVWGPCIGGKHAVSPDNCQDADPLGCHPINGVPFQGVDLKSGTGNFSSGASNESWTVTCPMGVTPCPTPTGANYQALQSGEYTVTYTRTVGGMVDSCQYPLYIGARGLRVELSWNYQSGSTIDLDLHMHEPGNATDGWDASGLPSDCGFINCKAGDFDPQFPDADAPSWFGDPPVMPPDPVNWFNDTMTPMNGGNLCYFAPRGAGQDWQDIGMGCHSPRLDLDNISCSPSITDPTSGSFCAPENINVDFPPQDKWTRIAVHYYPGTSSFTGTVTPTVKVFCDGKLASELGPIGYEKNGSPAAFTFTGPGDEDATWMVADVLFKQDQCSKECIVQPVYADPGAKTAFMDAGNPASFGPAQPPLP